MQSILRRVRTETEEVPKTDHLPDIKAAMATNGRLIQYHEKWLISEIERLRNICDELQKLIDKYTPKV